jgi:hypothetical protein
VELLFSLILPAVQRVELVLAHILLDILAVIMQAYS